MYTLYREWIRRHMLSSDTDTCKKWYTFGSFLDIRENEEWPQNQRPWMTLKGRYAICFKTHATSRAEHENLNENRPILSATKM